MMAVERILCEGAAPHWWGTSAIIISKVYNTSIRVYGLAQRFSNFAPRSPRAPLEQYKGSAGTFDLNRNRILLYQLNI